METVNDLPGRTADFALGVPRAVQAPRGGKFWLRHLIPSRPGANPIPTKPIAPYSEPGKGVSGESVNSNNNDSTWGTQGTDKIK